MQISSLLVESLKHTPRARKSGVYYPSDIGYCSRKIYYFHVAPPEIKSSSEADVPMILNFAMGDAIHDKLAQMFSRTRGIRLLENEKAFVSAVDLFEEAGAGDGGFVISGRLDDLIEVEVDENAPEKKAEAQAQPCAPEIPQGAGEENAQKAPGIEEKLEKVPGNGEKRPNSRRIFVVDVKSIKNFDYLEKPKPEHVLQLTYYLRVLRHHYPGIVGKLLYVNKVDFSMREFDVEYDEKVWKGMVERFKVIHRNVVNPRMRKTGPEPEGKLISAKNWECNYCPFRALCDFETGNGGDLWAGRASQVKKEESVEAFL